MIPKVTPRIPDTPGTFTIEWEDSLQKAGLILTEKLRDYWKDRSRRLQQKYSPVLTNLKYLTNQDQQNTVEDILEQIARETQQELKRNPNNKQFQQHNKPGQKKCKNCRYKKPNIPITNVSNHLLSRDEISLLSEGLNFIPMPRKDHPAKMLQDILLFDRKIRLKYHFNNHPDENHGTSQENTYNEQTNNQTTPHLWLDPPSGQDPFLDTYRKSIINAYLKELNDPTISKKKNLSHKGLQAMRDLYSNPDITIKPADKGRSIVIMNTTDYIQENPKTTFKSPQHCRMLDTDPTVSYSRYIHHIIDQAWRLGIIDGITKENIQTKNPKISPFYLLPKIHKPNNAVRPIVKKC